MTDAERETLLAFMANERLDETKSYVERGRALKKYPSDDLKDAWVMFMQKWAQASPARFPQSLGDIAAELSLRGEEPPVHRVEKELDVLAAAAKGVLESLTPQALEEANEELEADIEAFMRASARPKN